jgi:predicted nucleic acid-binding protein
VTALTEEGHAGDTARRRLRRDYLVAPEIVELEVASALRRQVSAGVVDARSAGIALRHLHGLPMRKAAHRPLLGRIWELRDTVTPYDAAYVALAELMGVTLVTADARLARAPGIDCKVEVLSA